MKNCKKTIYGLLFKFSDFRRKTFREDFGYLFNNNIIIIITVFMTHYHNPQCIENKSIELIHAELSTVYNLVKIIYSKQFK